MIKIFDYFVGELHVGIRKTLNFMGEFHRVPHIKLFYKVVTDAKLKWIDYKKVQDEQKIL